MRKLKTGKKFWEVKAAGEKVGELFIYGDITGYKWDETDVTAEDFRQDLESLGDIRQINIYVNSYGGEVFQAQAIYSQLKRHPAQKSGFVDGIAASAASIIVAACDTVSMPENAMQMIHWPWSFCIGNAQEMRRMADGLQKIGESAMQNYLMKAGDKLTEERLIELLDDESWLSAADCLEIGLCDEIIEAKQVAASATQILGHFKNVPEDLKSTINSKGDCLSEQARQDLLDQLSQDQDSLTKTLRRL